MISTDTPAQQHQEYHHHRRQSHHPHPLPLPTPSSTTTTSSSSSNNNNKIASSRSQFLVPQSHHDWSSFSATRTTPAIATITATTIPSPPDSHHHHHHHRQPPRYDITASNHLYSCEADQPLFDFLQPTHDYLSQPLMQTEQANNGWYSNGQLTPVSSSARARRQRESSLSSRGSVGPASPYTVNISNPQVAGELYHEFHDLYQPPATKPLTPAHTPSQEHFLAPPPPSSSTFYHSQVTFPSVTPDIKMDAMSAFPTAPGRASNPVGAMHDSSSSSAAAAAAALTPPAYDVEERRNHAAYRSTMPKLDRTMTDIYQDELYNPSFQFTSTSSASTNSIPANVAPMNDIFAQRLRAANNQHLSVSNPQSPLSIPSRERSPFRQGSPFAPSVAHGYAQQPLNNFKFGTATHMREQQKAENDERVLREQIERSSPAQDTPKTISPKDVDLVYHENEDDARMPLFPASASPPPPPPPTPPQQYPFVAQPPPSQPSLVSQRASEDFPASLVSMESSSSEYAPVRPASPPVARARRTSPSHSGAYTCTYHGCTMRFESPAQLQRHKRERHRSSVSVVAPFVHPDGEEVEDEEEEQEEEGGMTSAALRNTQNGPHKCARTNPSTGKPCNTIFSRPYDLTRHEDTIHNARRQKVRCHLCTEEKTFSRNDALTRHFRACHPERLELSKARRRNARD